MSFQAYLDNIEIKTGKTPLEILNEAKAKGLDNPGVKAGEVISWLKEKYDLGRGHAMALVYVMRNGTTISEKHVGSGSSHGDLSSELILTGTQKKDSESNA